MRKVSLRNKKVRRRHLQGHDVFFKQMAVSETLDELVSGLEKLEVRGLVIDGSAHQATLLQASSSAEKDVFVAQYNVPPTPDNLVLNLNDNGR